ncbi:MAG: HhH-GPD-type base excision DNA repair protein [Actinomycetota bacterium]
MPKTAKRRPARATARTTARRTTARRTKSSRTNTNHRDLYVTGITAADHLLRRDGNALLIGMLLDQQVPMEWAFTGPYTLTQRLGQLDPRQIASLSPDDFVTLCCVKPAIHRFPASMAKRIHELCAIIAADYANDGANIWRGVTDAKELYVRLRKLPGFGDEKAKIFIALLAKRFAVTPDGWQRVAKPFGDHRMRTVADIDSHAALLKVRRFKQLEKARDRDKQSRPLKKR